MSWQKYVTFGKQHAMGGLSKPTEISNAPVKALAFATNAYITVLWILHNVVANEFKKATNYANVRVARCKMFTLSSQQRQKSSGKAPCFNTVDLIAKMNTFADTASTAGNEACVDSFFKDIDFDALFGL